MPVEGLEHRTITMLSICDKMQRKKDGYSEGRTNMKIKNPDLLIVRILNFWQAFQIFLQMDTHLRKKMEGLWFQAVFLCWKIIRKVFNS